MWLCLCIYVIRLINVFRHRFSYRILSKNIPKTSPNLRLVVNLYHYYNYDYRTFMGEELYTRNNTKRPSGEPILSSTPQNLSIPGRRVKIILIYLIFFFLWFILRRRYNATAVISREWVSYVLYYIITLNTLYIIIICTRGTRSDLIIKWRHCAYTIESFVLHCWPIEYGFIFFLLAQI